jgi:hypothetical protein
MQSVVTYFLVFCSLSHSGLFSIVHTLPNLF